jgi:hypothetical protein
MSCSTKASRSAGLSLSSTTSSASDRADPVPDEIWNQARRHYDESGLASLTLWIGMTNLWNRLNVTTRQVAGDWVKSTEAQTSVESAVA